MRFYLSLIMILLLLNFSGCGSPKDKLKQASKEETITLTPKKLSTSLFYSGVIQPLKTLAIPAPADGVIQEIFFHYGDVVKAGQLLFVISSEKFQIDYKNALMDYIKAKNEFNTMKSQLTEGDFLHKNQLISDDDYKTKQNAFYTSQLALVQAKETLHLLLNELTDERFDIDSLMIENIDKITQALKAQGNAPKIRVLAPATGVILLPTKSEGDGENKKLMSGDLVKQGDILGVIGDTHGLTIRVNVNEFNINQLKIGQSVKVSGSAFPDINLQGKIAGLDKQAQVSTNGIPIFPIEIIVPALSREEEKTIHIGMTAKVEINIDGPPEISVPLEAVFEKDGQTFVNAKDPHTGKVHEVLVRTGQTGMDSVVIESNLKTGDQIVFTR